MHAATELFLFALFALPITLIDLRELRIPDLLTLGGIAVFIALRIAWHEGAFGLMAAECFLGFGVFWLIWWVTKGQIGLGDAKYSALIAVALGLPVWFVALFIAALLGLASAAILIAALKVDRTERIPFAPFLTGGSVLAIVLNTFHPWHLAFQW